MGAAKQTLEATAQADRRTVPERIADAIDYDIAAQRFAMGERLIETQLAERFGVGRGSVRDALRLLAQRGSVQLTPQRGAVVCGYSLDTLADVFAVAGMLIALGARYVALHRQVASIAVVRERVGRIEKMVAAGFSEPLDFATAIGSFTAAIVVESGNHYVRSQLSAVLNRSVWRAMWEHPCDHLTLPRQREELENLRRTLAFIEAGDANAAEVELRSFYQKHCDMVVSELARQRGERAPVSPPLAMGAPQGQECDRLARIEGRLEEIARAMAEGRPALGGRWKEKA